MNYINLYIDMTAYNADSTKQYPNTAKVESENRVLFQRSDPADLRRVICKYNVTSTSSPTTLLDTTTGISKQIIDGVEQLSVVKNYTFNTTGEHLVKYEFSNNQIDVYTFYGCSSLTSVTIPDGITSINVNAFRDCSSLASINIPNGVTTIGDDAFNGCSSLANVTIPNSVTRISPGAFWSCTNLTSITVESITPPKLGSDAFYNNAGGRKIYVPAESVEVYKAASNWSDYASAIEAIQ